MQNNKLSRAGKPAIMLLFSIWGCGQTMMAGVQNDSITARQLKEVVVEGENSRMEPGISKYTPTRQQKKAARNAIDLLRHMAISQIRVTPQDMGVTTADGNDIDIFINRQPATLHDIASLPAVDVSLVEFLTYPTDPRFGSAEFAINIVMRQYEYGGYTRLDAGASATDKNTGSINGGATSKMTYRQMTYDMYIAGGGSKNSHFGENTQSIFRFDNGSDITRIQDISNSKERTTDFQAAFRALYNGKNSSISNQVGFMQNATPYSDISGNVDISKRISPFSRYRKDRTAVPFLIGNYYFLMPKGFMLNLATQLLYAHINYSDTYSVGDDFKAVSDIREEFWEGKAALSLAKQISSSQALTLAASYQVLNSKDSYQGTSPTIARLNIQNGELSLRYAMQHQRVYASLDAGAAINASRVNGTKQTTWKPFGSLMAQYTYSNKSQLSLRASYSITVPTGSAKSSAWVRENEMLWITGNPDLKSNGKVNISLSHTWRPSQKFMMSSTGRYTSSIKRAVQVYTPDAPDGIMKSTFINSGNYSTVNVGISSTLMLLDNTLQLSVAPKFMYFNSTGIYNLDKASFYLDANLTYYLKDFYFMAYYMPEWRNVDENGWENHYRDYLNLTAGWSHEGWNIAVSANNLFRNNWVAKTSSLASEWYDSSISLLNSNRHRSFSLDISYTFSYGKKIRHRDELGHMDSPASTIIK